MATKYIVSSLLGTCAIAYVCDYIISDKKIFGGKSCLFLLFSLLVLQQFNITLAF